MARLNQGPLAAAIVVAPAIGVTVVYLLVRPGALGNLGVLLGLVLGVLLVFYLPYVVVTRRRELARLDEAARVIGTELGARAQAGTVRGVRFGIAPKDALRSVSEVARFDQPPSRTGGAVVTADGLLYLRASDGDELCRNAEDLLGVQVSGAPTLLGLPTATLLFRDGDALELRSPEVRRLADDLSRHGVRTRAG